MPEVRKGGEVLKKILGCVGIIIAGIAVVWGVSMKETMQFPATFLEKEEADSLMDNKEQVHYVVAIAQTMEEAEEIAKLYGMELESFSYKTAVYKTNKDPQELIRMGEERGYPLIAEERTDVAY